MKGLQSSMKINTLCEILYYLKLEATHPGNSYTNRSIKEGVCVGVSIGVCRRGGSR